jgi:hypothetical protein
VEVTKGSPDDEELVAVAMALDMVAARPLSSETAAVSKWKSSLCAGPMKTQPVSTSTPKSVHALTTLSRGCSRG